ncbi:hypothetical protein CBM2586_B130538 [Cupriavidus phytorum]|uniref:Uncharacterized protein n=1 Tax=Cupriavidus taiwanensis TaxID=164546 RepID=A0A975XL83_9BURK|nr:hypothetical protein CBM2586_B130538 [Cupriavidus taiwanensis]
MAFESGGEVAHITEATRHRYVSDTMLAS